MKKEKEEEICPECYIILTKQEHYWWCPEQEDSVLLRNLVDKFREIYDKLTNF